jgi:hypothetical protein
MDANAEYIGFSGAGAFTQSGGTHTVSLALYLGYNGGSSGSYLLNAPGSLTAAREYVGYNGTGTFTQTDGVNGLSGLLYVGYGSGSSGSYLLGGNGLLMKIEGHIGQDGNGLLRQTGGVSSFMTLSIGSRGRVELTDGVMGLGGSLTNSGLLDMSVGSGRLASWVPVAVTRDAELDLGGGTLAHQDANQSAALRNDGLFRVTSGTHRLGSIVPVDANILLGTTCVDAGATLIAGQIDQQNLVVSGTLVVPRLTVGSGARLTLAGGSLQGDPADSNRLTSVVSSGTIELTAGTWWLASLDCPDSNSPAGTVIVDAGATLCVGEISQGAVYLSGTLIFDSSLLGRAATVTAAGEAGEVKPVGDGAFNPADEQATPEPITLALLALAGPALISRRRSRGGNRRTAQLHL